MIKKIIVGILLFSVLGAGGAAIANQVAQEEPAVIEEPTLNERGAGNRGVATNEHTGEVWNKVGVIVGLDESGLTLRSEDGVETYVEIGPASFILEQGIQLAIGQNIEVYGEINEGQVHAYQLLFEDGQVLQVRSESGQPLWSGGATSGQGQNEGLTDGEHIPDPQAQVDEWITAEGSLMAFQNGSITMSTAEGELVSFQTGQPRFFSEQGVVFQVGDEIAVVGFYDDNGTFMAGEITQITTGLRVMLRDPNGRPLWAGPGNSRGNGNGGNGGNGQSH